MKLELRKIGDATAVILPEEILAQLGLAPGKAIYLTSLPDGGMRLTPHDPDFEKAMGVLDGVMDEYEGTLSALAR